MNILDNIKRECAKQGISVYRLSVKAGIPGQLYHWKTMAPLVYNVKAVADALGVTVDALLRDDPEEEGGVNEDGRGLDQSGGEVAFALSAGAGKPPGDGQRRTAGRGYNRLSWLDRMERAL